jgi:hypothetical protein
VVPAVPQPRTDPPNSLPPSKGFVLQVIEASRQRGYSFNDVLKDARSCWNDFDEAELHDFFDELVEAGEVVPHPGSPGRYLHPSHMSPRILHSFDMPHSLAVLGGLFTDFARSHTGPSITGDHMDIIHDGHGRRVVIYDRPVHIPPTTGLPRLQGP